MKPVDATHTRPLLAASRWNRKTAEINISSGNHNKYIGSTMSKVEDTAVLF